MKPDINISSTIQHHHGAYPIYRVYPLIVVGGGISAASDLSGLWLEASFCRGLYRVSTKLTVCIKIDTLKPVILPSCRISSTPSARLHGVHIAAPADVSSYIAATEGQARDHNSYIHVGFYRV